MVCQLADNMPPLLLPFSGLGFLWSGLSIGASVYSQKDLKHLLAELRMSLAWKSRETLPVITDNREPNGTNCLTQYMAASHVLNSRPQSWGKALSFWVALCLANLIADPAPKYLFATSVYQVLSHFPCPYVYMTAFGGNQFSAKVQRRKQLKTRPRKSKRVVLEQNCNKPPC